MVIARLVPKTKAGQKVGRAVIRWEPPNQTTPETASLDPLEPFEVFCGELGVWVGRFCTLCGVTEVTESPGPPCPHSLNVSSWCDRAAQ